MSAVFQRWSAVVCGVQADRNRMHVVLSCMHEFLITFSLDVSTFACSWTADY